MERIMYLNEIEISYSEEYDDYDVSLLTLDTDSYCPTYIDEGVDKVGDVVLARCLHKARTLSDATNYGIQRATQMHIPLGFSRAAQTKANIEYPLIQYVLIAAKMVSECNKAFFENLRERTVREIEDADVFDDPPWMQRMEEDDDENDAFEEK